MIVKNLARFSGARLRHCATLLFLAATMVSQSAAQSFPAFNWIEKLSPSGLDNFAALGTDAQGNVYVTGTTRSRNFPVLNAIQDHPAKPGSLSAFVTKLDPTGAIVYSTYFGGTADSIPTAMAVDGAGNAYITGHTASLDFPTSAGSYAPAPPAPGTPGPFLTNSGAIFLFKLGPDGALRYSTYVTSSAGQSIPTAIAIDAAGSVDIAGISAGSLQTTPGAYRANCNCPGTPAGGIGIPSYDGFVARLDPTGSKLVFATYLGIMNANTAGVAIAGDGSSYVATVNGVLRLDGSGTILVAQSSPAIQVQAMMLAPDGRVYVAGMARDGFQPTTGAFQQQSQFRPVLPGEGADALPTCIAILDGSLQTTLAATYFGDRAFGPLIKTIALDAAGNAWFGGYHARHGLPTRTPLLEGFGGSLATGFVSEFSGDLTSLLFSSYFGNGEYFGVTGLAPGKNGAIALGGATDQGEVWINSLQAAPPPAFRVDSVANAGSLLDDPLSPGEVIVVRGAGFGPDAQVFAGGILLAKVTATDNAITAVVPASFANTPVEVQVQSGGAVSNSVLLNVAATSPGLFSADRTGFGQGYIQNPDGTFNSPTNPAHPGDIITVFATGVGDAGALSVSIDGFHGDVVSGTFAIVPSLEPGFPGSADALYQLMVRIPDPASMAATNPNLANFQFPPQVDVVLTAAGAPSQNGLAVSIGSK